MVGQWMGKARKMAAEFQGQFQEAMREAEMADLKKSFDEVKEAASGFAGGNIMTSLQKDVTSALRIDDPDKPMDPQVATSNETTAALTSESHGDALATSGDAPAVPTTPEAPAPETLIEATTHGAVSEPLVITPETQPEPAAQHDVAPEIHRDAKAS
jgi:sec-independent protein translocase protein TatB